MKYLQIDAYGVATEVTSDTPGAYPFEDADADARVAANYKIERRNAYPPLGDQLDALWHAMDGGALAKVEPFYSEILAVKNRYPKPE